MREKIYIQKCEDGNIWVTDNNDQIGEEFAFPNSISENQKMMNALAGFLKCKNILNQENQAEFVSQIIDTFEVFLEARGIVINNPEREDAIEDGAEPDEVALLYGSDYGELQTNIEDILQKWNLI